MTTITDLSQDLIEEILSRVPITSRGKVRSTCKGWNDLSKDEFFTKRHYGVAAAKELQVVMITNCKACLMKIDLDDYYYPSVKVIGNFSQRGISQVFDCDGLLLLSITRDNTRQLLVWNPYLGQFKWIQPINEFDRFDRCALGYDNNMNLKLFRDFSDSFHNHGRICKCEIYNFKSNSWKVLEDNPDFRTEYYPRRKSKSLKGNTYFVAWDRLEKNGEIFLHCFDFTRERFGPRLHLPFQTSIVDGLVLSTVREEQLAVLFQPIDKTKIWITSKIEPDAVSWITFLEFNSPNEPIERLFFNNGTFFVDEKKKKAVVFHIDRNNGRRNKAHVIGEDGYCKEIVFGNYTSWLSGCSYVPSSVQIQ